MSHITTIKTELNDLNLTLYTLESMGFTVKESNSYVTYYGLKNPAGQTHEATHPSSKYTIALRSHGNTVDTITFDRYGSQGQPLEKLLGTDLCNLKTKYAEAMIYGYRNHLYCNEGQPSEMHRTETDNEIRIEIRI